MIVNIRELDAVLKERVISQLNRRSLNEEVPHFRDRAPSLEEFAPWIRDQLCDAGGSVRGLPATRLVRLVLEEEPGFYAAMERDGDDWMLTLTRSYDFSSGHRLYSEALGPEENWDLYGKDTNPAGHGHNFDLEVTVSGEPDVKTGMMVDIGKLDDVVKRFVVDRYDHKNMNVDIPELAGKVPTLEVVILEIWKLLDGAVPGTLQKIRLQENARNHCEVVRGE
jgi:6-pyruvoyltetrahydropterin/6-carboxytetrahydropterin synthase